LVGLTPGEIWKGKVINLREQTAWNFIRLVVVILRSFDKKASKILILQNFV
jgi:hypothetical protein